MYIKTTTTAKHSRRLWHKFTNCSAEGKNKQTNKQKPTKKKKIHRKHSWDRCACFVVAVVADVHLVKLLRTTIDSAQIGVCTVAVVADVPLEAAKPKSCRKHS